MNYDCAGSHHEPQPEQPQAQHYQRVSPITRTAPVLPEDGKTLLTGKAYINAAKTDVQRTWRKFGWAPPSEVGQYQSAHALDFPPINFEFDKDWEDEIEF